MKYGPLVFLATFLALSISWCGFVLGPQVQLGREQQGNAAGSGELYPLARAGTARQGLEVYRANGCAYCHSQQIRQTGIASDLILQDIGSNAVAVADAVYHAGLTNKPSPPSLAAGLPKAILHKAPIDFAQRVAGAAKGAGAKVMVEILPQGPDIERGWGKRRTVSRDFLYDDPAMPGSLRVGPDLANVGSRLPDANWQLVHLYDPRATVKDSVMPPHKFLFEERKLKPGQPPSVDALQFPNESAPPAGTEIVPKPEARMLVAYLLSLRAEAPLFEAPRSVPPPPPAAATNSPAK
jgi:cbb3-type cytochrome oxidase cytochrome c subunit